MYTEVCLFAPRSVRFHRGLFVCTGEKLPAGRDGHEEPRAGRLRGMLVPMPAEITRPTDLGPLLSAREGPKPACCSLSCSGLVLAPVLVTALFPRGFAATLCPSSTSPSAGTGPQEQGAGSPHSFPRGKRRRLDFVRSQSVGFLSLNARQREGRRRRKPPRAQMGPGPDLPAGPGTHPLSKGGCPAWRLSVAFVRDKCLAVMWSAGRAFIRERGKGGDLCLQGLTPPEPSCRHSQRLLMALSAPG